MNPSLSTQMIARNAGETRLFESSNCTHEHTKKARKFGEKCALCHTRVWKFWKTRKCIDCKSAVHRSCLAARQIENARNLTAELMTMCEATAKTVTSVRANAVAFSTERLTRGRRDTPMYVAPTPWLLANITAVMIDCRRRPGPISVVVNHGFELTVAMFIGLFDLSPVQNRPTTTLLSMALSMREEDLTKTETTSTPRHRQCSVEWYTDTREAGDTEQTTRLLDGAVERVGLETNF